uniref:Gag n=1 Tax=Haliotis discus hannai TaxID=42344 RepID=A0A290A080_HALDH|nr:Gag [Haliotis discus hannai]
MSTRYSSKIVAEAVRRSLRGRAARVAMHVDKDAPLKTLISKLASVFGDVHTEHNIMSQFYTAKQGDEESVAEWSCRLEDILSQGVTLGKVQPGQTEDLLRTTLWTGLRSQLRDLTSHKFDQGGHWVPPFYLGGWKPDLKEEGTMGSKNVADATSKAHSLRIQS